MTVKVDQVDSAFTNTAAIGLVLQSKTFDSCLYPSLAPLPDSAVSCHSTHRPPRPLPAQKGEGHKTIPWRTDSARPASAILEAFSKLQN